MNKVTCIPLRENFLRLLAEEIRARHDAADDPLALAQGTIVLPHRRGIVYLRDYLVHLIQSGKRRPFLLPRIVAIEDMVAEAEVIAARLASQDLS